MSQSDKARYFRALKAAGVPFDKHYREYTTEALRVAYEKLAEQGLAPELEPEPVQQAQPAPPPPIAQPAPQPMPVHQAPAPRAQRDPNEMAGQRQNSQPEDVPIRTDEEGRVWFQEEVLKPGYPKARGRRVLTYVETGTKQQTVKSGDYMESFEVAGDEIGRSAEVKITLPSYQVGIYKDPRFPFKVHTYNGNLGFDLFEVRDFYGGAELVPSEIKLMYVENVLCYDIRTTVRAIEAEYRQQQLAGKVI